MEQGTREREYHRSRMRTRNPPGSPDSGCRRRRDERFFGRPLRSDKEAAPPVQQCSQSAFVSLIGHCCTRVWACDSARSRVRAAEMAYGNCAGDNDRVTDAAVHHYRWLVLSDHRSDYARHLVLFDSAGGAIDYVARGVRRLATRKNHLAGNGNHTAGRRSGRCKQGAERRCAYLYRGIHCCTGQFALVDVDPRPALIESLDIKMDYALALPGRRISDLLS